MIKKIFYILVIPIALGFVGCQTLDDLDKYPVVEAGKTATSPIDGEFFVNLDQYDATAKTWTKDPYGIGFVKIRFSNTATNVNDMVWFDDFLNWPTKAKIKCDVATRSFIAGTYNSGFAEKILAPKDTNAFHTSHKIEFKAVNVDKNSVKDSVLVSGYGLTVKIIAGSIELGTYKAPSKFMADAINIELEWSDDPGTKYRYKGYRRTGYLEDEH